MCLTALCLSASIYGGIAIQSEIEIGENMHWGGDESQNVIGLVVKKNEWFIDVNNLGGNNVVLGYEIGVGRLYFSGGVGAILGLDKAFAQAKYGYRAYNGLFAEIVVRNDFKYLSSGFSARF